MEQGNSGRYRDIFEHAPEAMALVDSEGKIVLLNRKALGITGYCDAGEVPGMNITSVISEPDREGFLAFLGDESPSLGGRHREFGILRVDGTTATGEFFASRLPGNAGTIIAFRDVTEESRQEKALKSAVVFMNRLDSITRHDIMNQLTILLGYLELSRDMITDTTLKEFHKREEGAAETIRKQIGFTKEYQNIGVNPPAWTDIAAIAKETIGIVEHPGLKVDIGLPSGLRVFVDPIIRKIISNFIENTVIYGQKATEFTVSSSEEAGSLVLAFSDNGVGVPAENKELIFNRGFGTRRGYGLFLAREILALNGLTIAETGEPGKGARFEITVPRGMYRVE